MYFNFRFKDGEINRYSVGAILLHSSQDENIPQYATACRTSNSRFKPIVGPETPQDDSGLNTPQRESLTRLCEDVAARIEARFKQQRQSLYDQRYRNPPFLKNSDPHSPPAWCLKGLCCSTCSSSQCGSIGMRSPACSPRSGSEAPFGSPAARGKTRVAFGESSRLYLTSRLSVDLYVAQKLQRNKGRRQRERSYAFLSRKIRSLALVRLDYNTGKMCSHGRFQGNSVGPNHVFMQAS